MNQCVLNNDLKDMLKFQKCKDKLIKYNYYGKF